MMEFNFLAYDKVSGRPVAHARTAGEALQLAKQLAKILNSNGEPSGSPSDRAFEIIECGENGPYLWANHSPIETAMHLAGLLPPGG